MIIDFRIRPPFGGFRESELFCVEDRENFSSKFGFEVPESLRQKSIEILLQEMDEAGVDKAVVPARKLYHVTNDDLLVLLEQHGDRFYGMAGIDPLDGEKALQEIDKYILNGPCVGVTMEPGYCATPLMADDKRIYPIYKKCEENHIPIFLSFGGLVGPLVEYNDPIIVDRVAHDFPELVLILAHGGFPYATQACYTAFKNKNIYLVPDFYATRVPSGDEYMKATSYIPNKIIFGSGYPVQPVGGMLQYYREHLSEEAFARVSYENAAHILGLKKKGE